MEERRGGAGEAGSISAETHVELRGETGLEATTRTADEPQTLKRAESDRERGG